MTSEVLHTWVQGDYVGYFECSPDDPFVTFVYDPDTTRDVSLSLPRDGSGLRKAAQHFLDGLIPEDSGALENLRIATQARSTSSWDMLTATQGDLSGAIILSTSRDDRDLKSPQQHPASPEAVGAMAARLTQGGSAYESADGPPGCLIAGVQPKFGLHRAANSNDFWPGATTPSTHILKPGSTTHVGIEEVEAAALNLARACGLRAAVGSVETFDGNTTFMVERFDRTVDATGEVIRVHSEDVSQALGRSPDHKYEIPARDVITLLKNFGSDDGAEYEFIEQLAFNVAIGNADAHGKNYTLIHGDSGVTLSPLYDTVPIALYPEYSQTLSMKIGRQAKLSGVRPSDWVALSKAADLDADRVLTIVGRVEQSFLDHSEQVLGITEVAKLRGAEFETLLRRAERSIELNPVRV